MCDKQLKPKQACSNMELYKHEQQMDKTKDSVATFSHQTHMHMLITNLLVPTVYSKYMSFMRHADKLSTYFHGTASLNPSALNTLQEQILFTSSPQTDVAILETVTTFPVQKQEGDIFTSREQDALEEPRWR